MAVSQSIEFAESVIIANKKSTLPSTYRICNKFNTALYGSLVLARCNTHGTAASQATFYRTASTYSRVNFSVPICRTLIEPFFWNSSIRRFVYMANWLKAEVRKIMNCILLGTTVNSYLSFLLRNFWKRQLGWLWDGGSGFSKWLVIWRLLGRVRLLLTSGVACKAHNASFARCLIGYAKTTS